MEVKTLKSGYSKHSEDPINCSVMLEAYKGVWWVLVTFIVVITYLTSSAMASTAVTVSSEDISCLPAGKSEWSVTCVVIIPDQTYVLSVHVKARDQFNEHSIIATCSSDIYTFSSFAQFMGQSGRACLLPKHNSGSKFHVTFSFNKSALNSDEFSVPVRNVSCSTVVYSSNKKYEFYAENATQDLLQCVPPTIDLPPAFDLVRDSAAAVTCSALHGVPEANILLTVTPVANLPISVTGMNSVFIVINATLSYHKAAVNCTVLNHAHYLTPRMSAVLVNYIFRRPSMLHSAEVDTTFGNVLDCSEVLESYPAANFHWFMDEQLTGRDAIFEVSRLSSGTLQCLAKNSVANATVSVSYTLSYKLHVVLLLSTIPLFIFVVAMSVFIACRRHHKLRPKRFLRWQRRRKRIDAVDEHCQNESDWLNLRKPVELTEGVPASEVDARFDNAEADSQDAHATERM